MIPKEAPWKTSALNEQTCKGLANLVPLRLERSESAASVEHSFPEAELELRNYRKILYIPIFLHHRF